MENSKNTALIDCLKFTNARIQEMDDSELIGLFYTYPRFVCHSAIKYDFLGFKKMYERYMEGIVDDRFSDVFLNRKQMFEEIQNVIKSRLDALIQSSQKTAEKQKAIFPEMRGKRKFIWNGDKETMVEVFVPDGIKYSGSIDLYIEKKLADLALIDLMQDYDIQANRFRKCPKCLKYFYQETKKEKKYCSAKCATAARQNTFQKKKRR